MRGTQFDNSNLTEQIIDQTHWKNHKRAILMAETGYKVKNLDPI